MTTQEQIIAEADKDAAWIRAQLDVADDLDWDVHFEDRLSAIADRLDSVASLAAERDRLRVVLRIALATLRNAPELNPANMNDSDALELNHAVNECVGDLEVALSGEGGGE